MPDIFKGVAVTAVAWLLAFWFAFWCARNSAFDALWVLPIALFVLPLLLPNGRWLVGSVLFSAAATALLVKSAGDSLGATLGLAMLMWAAIATVLAIALRYAIRGARAWYRKQTGAPTLPPKTLPPISRRSVVLTACAAFALLAMYSLYVMYSAGSSAQLLAAGRPYCVQVASSHNYRSVTNRLDLLGFRMMGDGYVRHAWLAVRNGDVLDTYHWSYFNNRFEPDPYARPPLYCDLTVDFLAHPRRFRQEAEGSLSFLLAGQAFSIPMMYAPVVSKTGLIDIEIPRSKKVTITFGRDGKLEGWRNKPGMGWQVERLDDEHGLIRERARPLDSNYASLQFYELDSAGNVKTLVVCANEMSSPCTHLFHDGRLSYYFNHPASELSNWRQMEQDMSAMGATFIKPQPFR